MKERANKPFWVCCLGVFGSVAAGLLSGCAATTPGQVITGTQILNSEFAERASLRAEANAPGIPPADEERIVRVLGAIAARERQELAAYQEFLFSQKLALANASAPRITIVGGSGNGGERFSGQGEGTGTTGDIVTGGAVGGGSGAPGRFYVRRALEESAERMSEDAAVREQQSIEQEVPYGTPVEGKPGMVRSPTAPDAGYIDTRGYGPGSEVVDPFTGRLMRVP